MLGSIYIYIYSNLTYMLETKYIQPVLQQAQLYTIPAQTVNKQVQNDAW